MKPFLLVFLILGSSLNAATFYVDFNSGSDSNTSAQAQSQSTPWKRIPGVNGGSGAAASYATQPGDVFVLKGGVTWTFGTSANVLLELPNSNITIMGGQQLGTPWGSGFPILDGAGVPGTGKYGIRGASKNGITIDGLQIQNTVSNVDGGGFGIAALLTATNWEIRNCVFDNCGVDSVTMSLTSSVGNGSNFRVHGCLSRNCGRMHVVMWPGVTYDNVEICHNTYLG